MNIKKINIDIINMTKLHIEIDCNNKNINLNGVIKEITLDKIDDLLRIIRTWSNTYYKEKGLDIEQYKIDIIDNEDNIETLTGKGDYPINYISFKEWIRSI